MQRIGIDLGTTNTIVAIDSVALNFREELAQYVSSVVAYPPNGNRLVGERARRRRPIDPVNTIYSAKRIIGRSWHSAEVAEFRRRYPFDMISREKAPYFRTRAGEFSPTDIASVILSHVAAHKDVRHLVQRHEVVIAIPALFGVAQKNATVEAAESAGFEKVKTIPEPVATAAAYLSARKRAQRCAVVYDFGGGTFNIAVVDCETTPYRVLASDGDLYLGGDDLDFSIAEWAVATLLERHGWDLASEPQTFQRLVLECERAKLDMSIFHSASLRLSQVDPACPKGLETLPLPGEIFDKLSEQLVRRTFILCDQVLRRVGLTVRDVDDVFVSGGATLLPKVHEGVEKYFGRTVSYPFNPLQIVAIGASLASACQDE